MKYKSHDTYYIMIFVVLSLLGATFTTASSVVLGEAEAKEKEYCFTAVAPDGETDHCYDDKITCEQNFDQAINYGLGNTGCTKSKLN